LGGDQARIDSIAWYHEFDFGSAGRARTSHENPEGVRRIWRFIEQQLDGVPFNRASVLDVGAWDGYWSFLAERGGASRVLATDDATQRWANQGGVRLAKELLGSGIDIREDVPVYELASLGETFDIILCLGVFYHLWDPFYAFTQLRHCCHPGSIVVLEGEVAWTGMAQDEMRFAQSWWQECVLSTSTLHRLLRLAYLRVDEHTWMHPVPDTAPTGQISIDRCMLICRPFDGLNAAYIYRPHFGLAQFDERFRTLEPEPRRRARLEVISRDEGVLPGAEFAMALRVANVGTSRWHKLDPGGLAVAKLLSGPSSRSHRSALDYAQAFLHKRIVPGEYVNREPVERYRAFIEENWLHSQVTVGVQLWSEAGEVIDQDYARGFLPRDVAPGAAVDVLVRMRAPMTAGSYRLQFDVVSEYVCWFGAQGSTSESVGLNVR
jgi:tRNA (mo5U34)-methyltransferase